MKITQSEFFFKGLDQKRNCVLFKQMFSYETDRKKYVDNLKINIFCNYF